MMPHLLRTGSCVKVQIVCNPGIVFKDSQPVINSQGEPMVYPGCFQNLYDLLPNTSKAITHT